MGAPTSGLLAEFFLQHLELLHIWQLSDKHYRYVDDVLVIYNTKHIHTHVQNVLKDFNTVHPRLKFTAEGETNNKINFIDVTIHRTPTNWRIAVYRKPTFKETITPYTSNHPTQHKYVTVRFLYDRLHTYNLQEGDYDTDVVTIQNILHNNAFPIHNEKPPTLQHKNGLHSFTLVKKILSLLIYSRKPT